jgi:hypothetical protein
LKTKLKHLWCALENTPGLLAIPAVWRNACGADFGLIEASLRPTSKLSGSYPCPYPNGHGCPRRIVEYDDQIAATCQDAHRICKDLSLTAKDVVLHELNLDGLMKPILETVGIRNPQMQPRARGVWNVGLSRRRSSLNQPSFLLIFTEPHGLQSAVRSLLLEVAGPFLVVAPTNRHRSGTLQERLQARGVGYIALEEQVVVDDQGRFAAFDPIDIIDKLPPTPVADRERVSWEFRKKHKCKVYQFQEAAGVHDPEYYGWLHGTDPDHYASCERIETVLRQGLPPRP